MARRRSERFNLPGAMEDLRSDYRAGKDTRFQSKLTGVDPAGSGADYHYRTEREFIRQRERARDYARNNPVVAQGIRRLTSNVVQDGFALDVQTGDDDLDHELRARWQAWCCDPVACHSEGVLTFGQMERLAFSTSIVDGDVFALLLRGGGVQWVEAHRVRTPSNTKRNVVHGILLDSMRRRVEAWITKEPIDPMRAVAKVADIQPYRFRDGDGEPVVLHLCEPTRFSQTRGVTALAPVSETIGMLDDLEFATLVKAQIASLIAVRKERTEHWQGGASPAWGTQSTESQANGYTRSIEGLQAGIEIAGDVGEKISLDAPNVPSAMYLDHTGRILNYIAVNLDLPPHVLLLDPSKTNFSGWRGAIDQARLRFRQMQSWLISQFHSPVYRWKVRQWLARDVVIQELAKRSGVDPFGHRFNPPTWAYIEPMKDAGADLLQQRNALNSPRRVQAARGRDWQDVLTEIVDDNFAALAYAFEQAVVFNDRFGEAQGRFGWAAVHPRELISLPTPDGVTVTIGAAPQSNETEGADDE